MRIWKEKLRTARSPIVTGGTPSVTWTTTARCSSRWWRAGRWCSGWRRRCRRVSDQHCWRSAEGRWCSHTWQIRALVQAAVVSCLSLLQAPEYNTEKTLLSDTKTLSQILDEAVSLLKMFWRAALPSSDGPAHLIQRVRTTFTEP